MSCSNCYNGCSEIISDKCIKYTGLDVPLLGIKNGDSLSFVEQAIVQFLISALDGTGIKVSIPDSVICDVVKKYLPTCGEITAVSLFEAIIKSICDLQVQINTINSSITTINSSITSINNTLNILNANYVIQCLTGVTASSDTHDIVQAVITNLCNLNTAFTTLSNNVNNNFATKTFAWRTGDIKEIDCTAAYIAANFDGTGLGINERVGWAICNGNNGTKNRDGRVSVGYGTNYSIIGQPGGSSTHTLLESEMPQHRHDIQVDTSNGWAGAGNPPQSATIGATGFVPGTFSDRNGTPTISNFTVPKGGGAPHNNMQPYIVTLFIQKL